MTVDFPCGWSYLGRSQNWAHHAAHVNGREIANTHGHGFYSNWKDQWNNWLFRANANMWFSTRKDSRSAFSAHLSPRSRLATLTAAASPAAD